MYVYMHVVEFSFLWLFTAWLTVSSRPSKQPDPEAYIDFGGILPICARSAKMFLNLWSSISFNSFQTSWPTLVIYSTSWSPLASVETADRYLLLTAQH